MNTTSPDKVSHKNLHYIITGMLIVAGFVILHWGMFYVLIGAGFIYLVYRTYSSQHAFYNTFDPELPVSHQSINLNQNVELRVCPSCGLKQSANSKFCKSCGYNLQSQ